MIDAGATNWQLALTVAMGNAADQPELLLQPFEMLELMPLLASFRWRRGERGLVHPAGQQYRLLRPLRAYHAAT